MRRLRSNAATTARLRSVTAATLVEGRAVRALCLSARLASRPLSHFARLTGEVAGASLRALVRQDGSASGDDAWLELSQLVPLAPPAVTRWAGAPSPLSTTLRLARSCDRLLTLELVDVGRPNARLAAGMRAMWPDEATSFSMDVHEEGPVHHVHLTGEIDLAVAPTVEARLVDVAGSTVDVDLADVTFLDARGLSALLTARQKITAAGHGFRLRGAGGTVRRVFDLTGLGDLLDE